MQCRCEDLCGHPLVYVCNHWITCETKRIGILLEEIHENDQSSWSNKDALSYKCSGKFQQ